jgi:hypothetical protein
MKTSNQTRKNRTTAISRLFVLVTLAGAATLTTIKADEPGKKVHVNNAVTSNSADFGVFKEYKDYPQEVQDRLLEYRLSIALQEATEPKPEIEPWMTDSSHWSKLLKNEHTEKDSKQVNQDNPDDTSENLSDQEIKSRLVEYRLSVAREEEAESAIEIEDWMVDNSHWSGVAEVALVDAIQIDSEPEYQLEGWMLNVQSFSQNRHLAKR